jgi:hypothetical protein
VDSYGVSCTYPLLIMEGRHERAPRKALLWRLSDYSASQQRWCVSGE